MICAVACRPSICGMLMSMVMTSGFKDSDIATASRPSFAWPTTCNWSSALKIVSRTFRMNVESSTMSTRNFLLALVTIVLYATGATGCGASVPISCSTAAIS